MKKPHVALGTVLAGRRLRVIIPVVFILLGAGYMVWPKLWAWQTSQEGKRQNPAIVASLQETAVAPEKQTVNLDEVQRIQLPRLGIDLPVKPATYTAPRGWSLDLTNAFLVPANKPELGDYATPFIYAHNRKGLFYNLSGAAESEVLTLTKRDGTTINFSLQRTAIINPDETRLLTSDSVSNELALVTCDGPTFAKRRVLFFRPINEVELAGVR